jgi:hypothetical protein
LHSTTFCLLQPLKTPLHCVLDPLFSHTWLASIIKRLDHLWIDPSAISTKAAISDTALAPTHLWDQRILLPLPCIQRRLPYGPSRLLIFQRSHLCTEFCSFMASTHGIDWAKMLFSLRAEHRSLKPASWHHPDTWIRHFQPRSHITYRVRGFYYELHQLL